VTVLGTSTRLFNNIFETKSADVVGNHRTGDADDEVSALAATQFAAHVKMYQGVSAEARRLIRTL
jgi:hypothetical protein